MAAREDELESLVGKARVLHLVHRVLRGSGHLEQTGLRGEHAVTAQAVDRAVAGRDRQPGTRIGRHAVARPAFGGGRERLLGGFFGEIEVTQEADQTREDAAPLVAEDLLEQAYLSTSGRTSTAPPIRAAGIRAAISSATSRSSASTRLKPPTCSFASTNGPSVSSMSPFTTRTVVAVSTGCNCSPPITSGNRPIAKYSSTIACCSSAGNRSNSSLA